jgi:hypothetical protein
MDKVQKPSNPERHTPSSEEPFKVYLYNPYGPGIYPNLESYCPVSSALPDVSQDGALK